MILSVGVCKIMGDLGNLDLMINSQFPVCTTVCHPVD